MIRGPQGWLTPGFGPPGSSEPFQPQSLVWSTTNTTPRQSFWVGGTGNWSDAANHWAGRTGGTPGAQFLPDAGTHAIFDGNSGTNAVVTIDATANCCNFDMGACAPTPTLAGSAQLNVAGNIVLCAGMSKTYTGNLIMVPTTAKTFTSNGVALAGASVTMNGAGGKVTLLDAFSTAGSSFALSQGEWDTNGFSFISGTFTFILSGVAKILTLGASSFSCTNFVVAETNASFITLNAGTSTITAAGGNQFGGTLGLTFNNVTINNNGGTAWSLSGPNTFAALTLAVNAAAKTGSISLSANQTVTGTFKYLGNSVTNRLLISSSVLGTQRTITAAAIDAASNFADFQDINGAGVAAPFATGTSLGDCLGNSGITFTPSATQYWKTTTTGTKTWSTAANWFLATNGGGGAGRVPLPQDDVVFDVSSIGAAATIVNGDMPRSGRTIDWTGVLNAPTWQMGSAGTYSIFGSLTLAIGMTITNGGGGPSFAARSPVTLKSNGVSFPTIVTVSVFGSSLTLQDAMTTVASRLNIVAGTFSDGGFAVTVNAVSDTNGGCTITMSALWTITGTDTSSGVGSAWRIVGGAGTTITPGASTIKFTDTTAAKTFAGGGKTYNNLWFSGAGTGPCAVSGANTFNDLKIDKGLTVQLPGGATTTVTTLTAVGATATGGDIQYGRTFGLAGTNFTTPSAAANQITGDIDIRVNAAMESWTPAGTTVLLAKRSGSIATTCAYAIGVLSTGNLFFVHFSSAAPQQANSSVGTGFGAGTANWVRATHNVTTGVTQFFTSSDGTAWTQLGTDITTPAGALQSTTDAVEVGSQFSGTTSLFSGRVLRAQVLNGIGGSVALDFNPASYATGSSWTSSTGEVWTINGNAIVTATNCVGITSTTTSAATIAKSGGGHVTVDYAAIRLSTASPTTTFYAAHSFDEGSNTNWTFSGFPYSLTMAAGSYALAGQAASLKRGYYVGAAAGAFAMSGQAASLLRTVKLVAGAGSYVVSGQTARVLRGLYVSVAPGAYTLSGQNASLRRDARITATSGAYALAGQAATTRRGYVLSSAAGSYALAGQSAGFVRLYRLVAVSGAYALAGSDLAMIRSSRLKGVWHVAPHPTVWLEPARMTRWRVRPSTKAWQRRV